MRPLIHIVLNSLAMGGAERHTVGLANAASDAGLDVRLVTLSPREALAPELAGGVAARRLAIERRAALDARALARYRALVREDAPCLIATVNDYPLFFAAASLALAARPRAWMHVSHTISLPHEDGPL